MKQRSDTHSPQELNALALSIGAALRKTEADIPADISARLSHARKQALTAHQIAPVSLAKAAAKTPSKWLKRSFAIAPILAAAAGAVFMQGAVSDDGLTNAVKTDTQLLSSELPLEAYREPGFQAFLKTYKKPPTASPSESSADTP